MGAKSRRKGAAFERLIANTLKALWPNAKRALQARSGGEVCDVEQTPYFVECKCYERIGIFRWWDKAMSDKQEANDDREIALVVTEKGTSQALVCLRLEEFMRLQEVKGE